MFEPFLKPETLTALDAEQKLYTQEFTIAPAAVLDGNPGTDGSAAISITGFPFFTEFALFSYPTTRLNSATPPVAVDDGVCRLSLALKTSTIMDCFTNPLNLFLWAVPGREKTAALLPAGGEAPFAQAAHITGMPFKRYLSKGIDFVHDFQNRSTAPAVVRAAWWGYDIRNPEAATVQGFKAIVRKFQAAPFVQ